MWPLPVTLGELPLCAHDGSGMAVYLGGTQRDLPGPPKLPCEMPTRAPEARTPLQECGHSPGSRP